jgi:hypothetical protein
VDRVPRPGMARFSLMHLRVMLVVSVAALALLAAMRSVSSSLPSLEPVALEQVVAKRAQKRNGTPRAVKHWDPASQRSYLVVAGSKKTVWLQDDEATKRAKGGDMQEQHVNVQAAIEEARADEAKAAALAAAKAAKKAAKAKEAYAAGLTEQGATHKVLTEQGAQLDSSLRLALKDCEGSKHAGCRDLLGPLAGQVKGEDIDDVVRRGVDDESNPLPPPRAAPPRAGADADAGADAGADAAHGANEGAAAGARGAAADSNVDSAADGARAVAVVQGALGALAASREAGAAAPGGAAAQAAQAPSAPASGVAARALRARGRGRQDGAGSGGGGGGGAAGEASAIERREERENDLIFGGALRDAAAAPGPAAQGSAAHAAAARAGESVAGAVSGLSGRAAWRAASAAMQPFSSS